METKLNIQLTLSKGENQRRDLFKSLIETVDNVNLVEEEPLSNLDYQFFFDTDLIYRNKEAKEVSIAELLQFKERDFSKAILDVSHDFFDDEELSGVLTLCCVCAGFVTCLNAEIQEAIYLNTGRLAHIIDNPLTEDMFVGADADTTKVVKNPSILWFGTLADIFTIKEIQVKNKALDIKVLNLSFHAKKLDKELEEADIVFLPPCFDYDGEESRLNKVKYSLMKGKFVVAPKLNEPFQEIAFNNTLPKAIAFYRKFSINAWIKDKQKLLQDKEPMSRSLEQMCKAFDLIPEDSYLDNLEYYLENEEINI